MESGLPHWIPETRVGTRIDLLLEGRHVILLRSGEEELAFLHRQRGFAFRPHAPKALWKVLRGRQALDEALAKGLFVDVLANELCICRKEGRSE